jgi:hypothetical protein
LYCATRCENPTGSVVSEIMGVSSPEMLRAIPDGEDDPLKSQVLLVEHKKKIN